MVSGTLHIVATPIGNLEDITLRALRVLKEADLIAAEDTRRTRKLLSHYGIATPMISYHAHHRESRGPELIRRLQDGQRVALVSDAGTPGFSDPGPDLVALAWEAGIRVEAVPGPAAGVAALSLSG
ncbi:MAG: ribosomal RNA small subunit methyltransferase I, partial [Desulfobaccales bacterium]